MSTTDLPGSSLLAGRYRLVERLGAGGMSVVWRGFDEVLGRQVAVKVLPPSTSTDPSFRRRLRAEAQAAARLSHAHITSVYDYGEATTADGEPVPYVVMELIDGESLAAVLARVRRLPWQQAVRITAEVAAALAAAHSRGIVHRDVTPANVMLTPSGAKVVDFGISALIGENDIDPDGSLLGTPAYLAPERLEGGQVSPATDVYAVGLLIYRTLIGQLPWDVGTTTALLRAHQYTEPEPLPPVDGLPPAVAALVGRCLEKRPDDRPSSAELAHVLAGISAGAPVAARGLVPDWSDNGEDTTILPSQQSYAIPPMAAVAAAGAVIEEADGPQRHSGFAALVEAPAADAAGPVPPPGGPALRPAFGSQPPGPMIPAQRDGGPPASDPGPATGRFRRARDRRLAVAGALVLVACGVAYGLSATDDASNKAVASGALPQPSVVPASGKCVVSYAVWTDANGQFSAQVTLANWNDTAIDNWRLQFIMPGDQVVSGRGKVQLYQQDHGVTVTSTAALSPQKTVTVPIVGRYVQKNIAPLAFTLNGNTCETFVSAKPGEPSRQVEHLSDGGVRLGPTPSTKTPIPGISIDPGGVVHVTPTITVRPTGTHDPAPSVSVSTSSGAAIDDGGSPSPSESSTEPVEPNPGPSTSASVSESPSPSASESSPVENPGDIPGLNCDTPIADPSCPEVP
jgi:eukaryotic-like serine/threonine-protein kinase